LPNLNRAPFESRALKSGFLTALTWIAALLASVPLFSVIYMLSSRAARAWTGKPDRTAPSAFEQGAVSVMPSWYAGHGRPRHGDQRAIGIFAASIWRSSIPIADWRTACAFLSKALTGFPPSWPVFVYAVLVVTMKTYSALAGGSRWPS